MGKKEICTSILYNSLRQKIVRIVNVFKININFQLSSYKVEEAEITLIYITPFVFKTELILLYLLIT